MNMILLLAEGFADSSFARLFTEMSPFAAVLFILGIIFCAIEMFIPGFGFFGISGSILIFAGIIIRLIGGGDAMMLLYMLLIALVLFFLMFFVISRAITKGRLSKTSLFSVKPSVSENKTEGTRDFTQYIGATGTTQTALRPVGKAMFGSAVLDVVAEHGFIANGVEVECVSVEGQKIVVVESKK